ncbi:hypothetical protein GCM10011579_032350 [Streptomyces albiflavescens]|uniref:HTH luxR-type domain-containing protein n=1 Tax=Streptomyces albiflavescens TaxID=1623582 RepID=A0A918D3W9_9ACTN|nr:helix-turn-helix transcriptional regulator [Streptomyces albiflavescens]GGN63707.1 hypothetical protein GCM10011579_032350 [Streptomyces albiflavescens]
MSLTLTLAAPQTPAAPQTGVPEPALAPRERETLRHIAAGRTYLQTARQMGLSKHTVDAYLRRIRAKLNINSTAELTRLAISLGL